MDCVISILVPIYNVEKYMDECILSIINQTESFIDNVQLIFVNDGSPDNSGVICKKYMDQYPDNIVYVERENGGLSAARNTGLKYATGDYIWFIDPDDYIKNNSLEILLKKFRNIQMQIFSHLIMKIILRTKS